MVLAGFSSDVPGPSRERVLHLLKTNGPQTSARVAKRLGVTTMAVRQHLAVLQGESLVEFVEERRKIGRPVRVWQLTEKASKRFPDQHAELAVDLIEAIRCKFGEEELELLTAKRARKQIERYRGRMPDLSAPIAERVAGLTQLRCEEGFMAEWRRGRDGSFEIVENHCAIIQAARVCPNLCGAELSLFRASLGDDLSVNRVKHVLSGDRCCAYSITELAGDSPRSRVQ